MALCFLAPRFSKRVEAHSKILLLIGTGGLISLYFADLLPDVVELGGKPSLGIILLVWLAYSYLHTFNIKHHEEHDRGDHACSGDTAHVHVPLPSHNDDHHSGSSGVLLASMISHCFSSGMLLFVSHELSSKVAASVFLALIGHKGYEAISVSVVLSQRTKDIKKFMIYAIAYASSFPVGVLVTAALTRVLGPELSPAVVKTAVVVVASVAVGSLASCMIHDFLLPSLRHVRAKKTEAVWMLVGVGLTALFTFGV